MSKFAHSDDASMAQIERNAAREAGELRKCRTCDAENIVDDPECPRDGTHCEFYTMKPTMGEDRS